MSRSAVVVNPAKVEDCPARRKEICAELSAAGWPEPMWLETTKDDPGAGQARQAIEDGVELVFAFGGDGTVMACVTALAESGVALAVLPSGTGNLLAHNLGLPDDVRQGVRLATAGDRRTIDVGAVGDRRFAVMAGMGFDALMLRDAPEGLKKLLGWPAYVVSALRHLRDRRMQVTLHLDDGEPLQRKARSVVVGNVGRLQGGLRLLPDAVPDDGCLDVAVIAPRSLADWFAVAWAVLRRRRLDRRLETFRARHVRVTSTRPQPRELDGDGIGSDATLEVQVRPAALTLCVPRGGTSGDMASAA